MERKKVINVCEKYIVSFWLFSRLIKAVTICLVTELSRKFSVVCCGKGEEGEER